MNSLRWAAWGGSLALLLVVAGLWSGLDKIEEGGALRIGYHSLIWVGMLGAVFFLPSLSSRKTLLLILGAAILVRIVFWTAPVSNDVNRYLWEGRLIWEGENPYSEIADSEDWSHLRDQYWEEMNHRERLTAYPPGMELVMAAASRVWYDLQVFKVVALLGDFWIFAMLVILLERRKKPLRWLGFYAFNPVILASFAVEAHLDSLMVGAFFTTILCAERKSWGWAWFWLGVAVQMKLMVLVLAPFIFLLGGWRKALSIWPFLLVLVLPSLLFVSDLGGLVKGVFGFGSAGAFNGGLFELLRWLGVAEGVVRSGLALLFLAIVGFYSWRVWRGHEFDLVSLSLIVLGSLVVLSPVVHFWYLSWLIPLVALRPQLSWLALYGATGLYFLTWENQHLGNGWGYSPQLVIASWVPFFALLIWENRFYLTRLRSQERSEKPSLDIVLPVYNAGPSLAGFLSQLQTASAGVGKIFVVDGGSEDDSVQQAKEAGCEVLSSPKGRGNQIATGFEQSSADLVAVVHADTIPQTGWIEHVQQAAVGEKGTGFILGQRFDVSSPALLFIEILNEARVIFGGSAFGDQTMVLRRAVVEAEGGFPKQALMEDVEVSWRLLRCGPLCYLGTEWQVSATKWKGRFGSRFCQVVGLMIRYRWARMRSRATAADLSEKLYREYYSSGK